jgi:hypothetical protein
MMQVLSVGMYLIADVPCNSGKILILHVKYRNRFNPVINVYYSIDLRVFSFLDRGVMDWDACCCFLFPVKM